MLGAYSIKIRQLFNFLLLSKQGKSENVTWIGNCLLNVLGSYSTMYKHSILHARSEAETLICCKTPEMFACGLCEFQTNLRVDLIEHVRVFHEGKEANEEIENILKWYHCKTCDFATHSLLVLTKHVNNYHAELGDSQEKSTNEESSGSSTEMKKWDTFRTTGGNYWYQCKRCCYQSVIAARMRHHVMSQHTDPKDIVWYLCPKCDYKSCLLGSFWAHFRQKHINPVQYSKLRGVHVRLKQTNSEVINWFQCVQCSNKYKNNSSLKHHVLVKHTNLEDIKWFQCAQCANKFKSKTSLKNHVMAKHRNLEDIKWLQCAKCSNKYKSKTSLKNHVIVKHTNPEDIKWFQCTLCPCKYPLNGSLTEHIKKKHSAQNIHGPAVQKRGLTKHVNSCHTAFSSDSHIKNKKLVHAGNVDSLTEIKKWGKLSGAVRGYKCSQCSYESAYTKIMRNHVMSQHTD